MKRAKRRVVTSEEKAIRAKIKDIYFDAGTKEPSNYLYSNGSKARYVKFWGGSAGSIARLNIAKAAWKKQSFVTKIVDNYTSRRPYPLWFPVVTVYYYINYSLRNKFNRMLLYFRGLIMEIKLFREEKLSKQSRLSKNKKGKKCN